MARTFAPLVAVLSLCGIVCIPASATAQLAPSGASFQVYATGVRGTASAYDPTNNVFLVVSAYGHVSGRFVRPDGTFASDPFGIDTTPDFAHYPSVAYSPDTGAFLVTWHQNFGTAGNRVRTRLVGFTSGLMGTEQMLGTEPTWWESAPNVDYAAGSKRFLVTWRVGAYQIRAARIGNDGTPVEGNAFQASPGLIVTNTGGEQSPSVGYNPDTDNFLIVYSDFLNGTHVYGRLVSASTGAVSGPTLLGSGTATYLTDVTFSATAHKYFAVWYQLPGGPMGRLVNGDGTPAGDPFPLSSRFGSYDALGVAYSPVSQSHLVVGSDRFSAENGGVEISDAGVPTSSSVLTNAGGPTGNFYPQVSASTKQAKWLLTTAHNFTTVVAQLATSTPRIGVTLTADRGSPVFAGTLINLTATPTGALAPVTFQFWQWKPGPGWFLLRDFNSSNSIGQTVGVGPNRFRVVMRSSGADDVTIDSDTFTAVRTPALALNGNLGAALTYNSATGAVEAKLANGASLTTLPYTVAGAVVIPADFDGNGQTDFLIYNATTGEGWKSVNNGSSFVNYPLTWGAGLSLTVLDFNGDGYSDVFAYNPTSGAWTRFLSTGAELIPDAVGTWAPGWRITPGDFNGDGYSDLFLFNGNSGADPNNGKWFRVLYTPAVGFSYIAGDIRWANYWQVQVADFNADGRSDLFLTAPDGHWFKVFFTGTGATYDGGLWANYWTIVPGDFTGDRATDLFLYDAATGRTILAVSTGGAGFGYIEGPRWATGWQMTGTEFDGNGLTDLLLYKAATGSWMQLSMVGVNVVGQRSGTWAPGQTIIATGRIF